MTALFSCCSAGKRHPSFPPFPMQLPSAARCATTSERAGAPGELPRGEIIVRLLSLVVFFLFSAVPAATAQGFQISPLSVEGDVPPGTAVEIPIEITPTSLIGERVLQVEVVQLAQSANGAFRGIPFEEGADLPRSAAPWITAPSEVVVLPREPSTLTLIMDVPTSARGAYAAGILLVAELPEGESGVQLTVRVLIPIIVTTEGRLVRQEVRLSDARLRYRFPQGADASEGTPEAQPVPDSTLVDAVIENAGGTFSRFTGGIWVDVADDTGAWRQVRRVDIAESRLLPETAITLPVDVGRLLPSGEYRIRGELYVDGRRTAPLRREITFEGHPEVEALLTDIELPIEPALLVYDYREGATRTSAISFTNPSIDPVEVRLSVELPQEIAGRASASIRDTDISAADWIQASPEVFTLRPGQSRNVRLTARFPASSADQQNYYATLAAEAIYLDGQRAGASRALIEVKGDQGEDAPELEMTALRLSGTENAGEYALSARVTNIGNVLVRPGLAYFLVDDAGQPLRSADLTSSEDAPLLPLAARGFGATVETGDVEEGAYTLLIVARDGDRELTEQSLPVRLSEEGGLELLE